jgi:uncharacterized membrane protein
VNKQATTNKPLASSRRKKVRTRTTNCAHPLGFPLFICVALSLFLLTEISFEANVDNQRSVTSIWFVFSRPFAFFAFVFLASLSLFVTQNSRQRIHP